jgi:hypothetical protein
MTCAGEGKAGCVSSKRAVNFLRMEAAAAPETYRPLLISHVYNEH